MVLGKKPPAVCVSRHVLFRLFCWVVGNTNIVDLYERIFAEEGMGNVALLEVLFSQIPLNFLNYFPKVLIDLVFRDWLTVFELKLGKKSRHFGILDPRPPILGSSSIVIPTNSKGSCDSMRIL